MAGMALGDPKLSSWAKSELAQVFFSIIIFIFAVALAGSMDVWLKTISLASSDPRWITYVNSGVCCTDANSCISGVVQTRGRACHIEIASDYLQMMYESTRLEAKSLLSGYSFYGFLGHLSVSISDILKELATLGTYPFAGLNLSADYYSMLFDLATKTMLTIRAQQIFIDFIWFPLFPVMLSMGLVLRMFYFTRKLGGLLIALALSFYIVFPMFYVLADAIFWGFVGGWTVSAANPQGWQAYANTYDDAVGGDSAVPMQEQTIDLGISPKQIFDASSNKMNFDMCGTASDDEKLQLNNLFTDFKGKYGVVEHSHWYDQFLDAVESPLFLGDSPFGRGGPIGTLANIMVFTIFIPFIAFMTTLASFKVLSAALGGDVEISLLSRLI
jgi:hypothetical protein